MNILKTILFTGLTFLQANLLAEEWVFEEYIDKENNELNYTASITKENLKEYISIFCSEDSKDTMFLFSSIEEKSKNEIKKINIYFDDLSEFYLKAFKSDDLLYFSASTFKNNDVNKEYNFKEQGIKGEKEGEKYIKFTWK